MMHKAIAWVAPANSPRPSECIFRNSKVLAILLGGGTKRRQQSDIATALRQWRNYKARKAAGRTKRK